MVRLEGRPESKACLLCPIVRSDVSAPAAEMLTAGSSAAALTGTSQRCLVGTDVTPAGITVKSEAGSCPKAPADGNPSIWTDRNRFLETIHEVLRVENSVSTATLC